MHNSIYASGFLYNLETQQILLLQSEQSDNLASSWSMLGGECREGEEALAAFQRIVNQSLNLDLKTEDIHPIYDYFHNTLDKTNYVFYAEVSKDLIPEFPKKNSLAWVTFNETLKLLFAAHIKQDVIVGQRVINLKWRVDQNLQPLL